MAAPDADKLEPPQPTAQPLHPSPSDFRVALAQVDTFNEKAAVFITKVVGSMWCAYGFAVLALLGIPAATGPGGIGLVQWLASTFLQLVLLSVIIVGQNVQAKAADQRTEEMYELVKRSNEMLEQRMAQLAQEQRAGARGRRRT